MRWLSGTMAGVLALGLTGCDLGDSDTDITVDTSCPGTYDRTTDAGVTISQLTLSGLSYIAGFDATKTYDGEAAACVDEDGTKMRLIVESDAEPFLTLWFEGTATGAAAISDAGGNVKIDVYPGFGGADGFSFTSSDWQSGTYDVVSVGSPLSVDLNGTAVDNGQTLVVTLSAEATP